MSVKLRNLIKDDAELMVRYLNDSHVTDNLRDLIPQPYHLEDGFEFVKRANDPNSKNIIRGILYNDKYVGTIGLHPQSDVYRLNAEIGYWLADPFWGNGIMTEAIRQMLTIAEEQTDLLRIFAGVYAPNIASGKALEKNGFII